MKFDLRECKNILIWGGGRGIGLALVKRLITDYPGSFIHATYRDSSRAKGLLDIESENKENLEIHRIDFLKEEHLTALAENFRARQIQFDLIINCVGFLHDEDSVPEKSLSYLSREQMLKSFEVNTVVTGLLARYLVPLISKENCSVFASLSAKVGSISDNKIGGWYSYRASKAALNMLLKTISIELKRKRYPSIVLSIHPGTTETDLSRPFISNTNYKIHSPDESATNILSTIQGTTVEDSGSFFSWDGEVLPW